MNTQARLRPILALALTLGAFGMAGCAESSPGDGSGGAGQSEAGAETFEISGYIRLNPLILSVDQILAGIGAECFGEGRYKQWTTGAPVTVLSVSGAVVAEGTMGRGSFPDDPNAAAGCYFPISIDDVPTGEGPYSIKLVDGSADEEFTEDELREPIEVRAGF